MALLSYKHAKSNQASGPTEETSDQPKNSVLECNILPHTDNLKDTQTESFPTYKYH